MYLTNILPEFQELTEKLNDTSAIATNYTLPILSKCIDSLQQEIFDWQYFFMIVSLLFIVCIVLFICSLLCDNGK